MVSPDPFVSLLVLLTESNQDLVSRFSDTDPKVNVGVLEVAHSIFVRWRPLYRTDELYTEINHVLNNFGEPYVRLLIVRSSFLSHMPMADSLSRRQMPRSQAMPTTRRPSEAGSTPSVS